MGYFQAGFNVVGVDLVRQPRYPFEFIQADALDFLRVTGHCFDVVHASPPCQRFSAMSACRPGLSGTYPDLVAVTRNALIESEVPWVIENVPGSPLRNPVTLCGQMFGLRLYRHRLFESEMSLAAPPHPPHDIPASKAGHWEPGTIMSVAGHFSPASEAREAMGIDWMNREELGEAVPPTYTEHIGRQLLAHLRLAEAA